MNLFVSVIMRIIIMYDPYVECFDSKDCSNIIEYVLEIFLSVTNTEHSKSKVYPKTFECSKKPYTEWGKEFVTHRVTLT